MSSAKHTPAPWFAVELFGRGGRHLGWMVEHSNGRIGWSSYATARPNAGEPAPHPISAANAHLMAAAPEGYEMASALEHALARGVAAADVLGEYSPLRAALRAYIAKCEGRA